MEFSEREMMSVDVLATLRTFCVDIFEYRISRTLLWTLLLIHSVSFIINSYFYIYILDSTEKINYAHMFFSTFYGLSSILSLIKNSRFAAQIFDELPLWTINSAGSKTYRKIKREIKLITAFSAVLFILCALLVSIVIKTRPQDDRCFLMIRILKSIGPNLEYVYRYFLFLSYFVSIVCPMQFLYSTQHLKFQLMMFVEYLKAINPRASKNLTDEELFYDEKYQNEVSRRLIFCFKRFEEFIEFYVFYGVFLSLLCEGYGDKTYYNYSLWSVRLEKKRVYFWIFGLTGPILGISTFTTILFGQCTFGNFLEIVLLMEFLGLVSFIWAGQSIENVTDFTNIIINIRWYTFDRKNKKLYSIFITHMTKIRRLKILTNISVNYQLGVLMFKAIYSVISMLAQTI